MRERERSSVECFLSSVEEGHLDDQ